MSWSDGVMTNSDFQLDLISDSNVIAGDCDTAFLMEEIFTKLSEKSINIELCKCNSVWMNAQSQKVLL